MMQRSIDPNLLRQVSLFRTLDEAQVEQVAVRLKEQRYHKGQIIFQQGEPGGCLHIIVSGRVRVYVSHIGGRELTLRIYGKGSHFGEFSVLDGAPRSASVAALSSVTTFVLYQHDFLELMQEDFGLVQRVLIILTERLRYTTTYSEQLAFLNAPGRLAATLVQLASQEGTEHDPVRLEVTQQDLATLVCTTRESVNHALRDFADAGLIRIERGAVVVLSRDGLQHLSE